MRYEILACDYDGTLATLGQVTKTTIESLKRVLATGRKLVLVTGRELDELIGIFPEIDLFTRVVAENGALIYDPAAKEVKIIGQTPPEDFINSLRVRGVAPLSVGRVIVASWRPHEIKMLGAIHDHGLDLQVIFNKDAVMLLPAGVNKATGLAKTLKELGSSYRETVGVGDAENDLAFLSACRCAAAVANALPSVKERVDFVTTEHHGAGVEELIELLLENDLESVCLRATNREEITAAREGDAPP